MRTVVIGTALLLVSASAAMAQAQTQAQPPSRAIPVKLDVVLSRFEGEKKVSSLPFTLWLSVPPIPGNQPNGASAGSSIRMGVDVPIGTTARSVTRTDTAAGTSTTLPPSTRPEYKNVGTQIDCRVYQYADGRFNVNVNVDDSSIYTPGKVTAVPARATDPMAFRTFVFGNSLPMSDGQTQQFGMGTDKISGETLRVDVSINVVK